MSTALLAPPITAASKVDAALREHGHAVLDAADLHARLGATVGALDGWQPYWSRLPPDAHLRDGGRYRQRRHACFVVEGDVVRAVPHRAHWQPVEYNALHGGIERWFEPLEPALMQEPLWPRLLQCLAARASALRGAQPWYVEAHPFRIDTAGGIGRPTPEGAHRDGVDLVAVLLVARVGVKGGETRVFDADGPAGLRFTMSQPWTTLLLDDARVIHETTPIQPLDAQRGGHRDTLVITLRAGAFQGPGEPMTGRWPGHDNLKPSTAMHHAPEPHVLEPLPAYREYPVPEMIERARAFHAELVRRRTVRDFDTRAVPREVIEPCLLAAGTAPSGANQQPWFFSVITDPEHKRRVREAAEVEERTFYNERAPQEWLDALAPLGTDSNKPFLEEAPVLIAIFAQKYGVHPDGEKFSHYYVPESVGIASGFLIAALHHAGLATLTHTPNPMSFLNKLCGRPSSEKPVILLVVGYPKSGCKVPVHGGIKKPLEQIAQWL